MNYIKVSEAAEKWGISERRVRLLCSEGRIEGAEQRGKLYFIPENAQKPADARRVSQKSRKSSYSDLFTEIDLLKAELDSLRPLTSGEAAHLREEFMLNFTYNSNAIEGNTLTLSETRMVLQGLTIDKKPLKDHLEAVGHRDAFLYIEEIAEKEHRLTETEIKNIHSLVLINRPEDKGTYRKIPVIISGAFTKPAEPYLIQEKLSELIKTNEIRKKVMHTIERAARFHLEFEGIHPFIDGNGRTGRLILNLQLIRAGFPAINVKFTDRKRYYEAFDAYYRDGSADEMVCMLSEYVKEELKKYIEILK